MKASSSVAFTQGSLAITCTSLCLFFVSGAQFLYLKRLSISTVHLDSQNHLRNASRDVPQLLMFAFTDGVPLFPGGSRSMLKGPTRVV